MGLVELSTQAFNTPKNAAQRSIHAMHTRKRNHLMNMLLKFTAAATLITLATPSAHATNGMNQESYGAKAGGMGGASVAYDSRTIPA